jgi:putative ABC transport system permease protein
VLLMLAAEGMFVTLLGAMLGVTATLVASVAAGPWLQQRFGIHLTLAAPTAEQGLLLAAVLAAGFAASLVPGWRAYRLSLADGLSPRA